MPIGPSPLHIKCERVQDCLSIATERVRQLGIYCEKTFQAFYYAALDAVITCFGILKNNSIRFSANLES